ncbi:hypothetical protein HPB51_021027 [Rhipicephalus microplus]|uniref:Armadillo repeat-containing protein 8 n=1 Tax=Rhipicephalus microplus TaxID=6941 RepID=A0A9J6DCP9_RHIMP|nr:hypothetical protein HPB51_021027 [Rhipicephalus microplus]
MNTTRGVVSDADLLGLTEEELLEGWKSQNVTNVQRIIIRRHNKPILECGAVELLCGLTRRDEPALRLNGVWALMNMAFQADQKIKSQILSTLGTDQVFRLFSDPDVSVLMKTLGLLRNLLSIKQHIDHIMDSHGTQIMQAVILILEGDHSADVKEQALCILANIADGDTAKAFIMANEDVLKKLTTYIVSKAC